MVIANDVTKLIRGLIENDVNDVSALSKSLKALFRDFLSYKNLLCHEQSHLARLSLYV